MVQKVPWFHTPPVVQEFSGFLTLQIQEVRCSHLIIAVPRRGPTVPYTAHDTIYKQQELTKYAPNFKQLSPADHCTHRSVRQGCTGMWQTYWSHVVTKLNGRFHLQNWDIIDEAGIHILRVKYDLGNRTQLLVWGWKFGSSPQGAEPGHPVIILSPGEEQGLWIIWWGYSLTKSKNNMGFNLPLHICTYIILLY